MQLQIERHDAFSLTYIVQCEELEQCEASRSTIKHHSMRLVEDCLHSRCVECNTLCAYFLRKRRRRKSFGLVSTNQSFLFRSTKKRRMSKTMKGDQSTGQNIRWLVCHAWFIIVVTLVLAFNSWYIQRHFYSLSFSRSFYSL